MLVPGRFVSIWLGQFSFVRADIELMLILIVGQSVLPIVVEAVRARRGGAEAP